MNEGYGLFLADILYLGFMKKSQLIIFVTILLSTMSCKNKDSACHSLEDHADSPGFRAEHELPDSIQYVGKGEELRIPVIGGDPARVYAVFSEEETDHYLFVFHEWWGLNDQIRREADRFADALPGVHVFALDLYDGEVATDRDRAAEIMSSRKRDRMHNIIEFVRRYAGPEAKIGTVGWCFGGGWSLRAASILGAQANGCVIYYGKVGVDELGAGELIQTDVLGIFAEQDEHITISYAEELRDYLTGKGVDMRLLTYDADHAFANPSSPRYVQQAAQAANAEALAFLGARMQ